MTRNLSGNYANRNIRGTNNTLHFNIGEKVVIKRGPNGLFEERCTIQENLGNGAWKVQHKDGKKTIINQRYIRATTQPASEEFKQNLSGRKVYDLRRRN